MFLPQFPVFRELQEPLVRDGDYTSKWITSGLLVTQGTLANRDLDEIDPTCVSGLAGENVPVIVATGRSDAQILAPAPGWSGIVDCEVLEVVPHRLLVYSWRSGSKATEGHVPDLDTVVTWRLTPLENSGTRLYLEHSGFDPDSFVFKAMGQGWKGKFPRKSGGLAAQSSGELFRPK